MLEVYDQKKYGGLLWEDINFENDSFWAGRHTVVKNGIYDESDKKIGDELVLEDYGKTPHAPRELPLGTFLSKILKAKYQEYIDKGITPKPTDFVFYTKAGNPFYEQSLRKMYKSLAKKLGISEVDKQYEDNTQIIIANENIFARNNIIEFPLKKVVNK